MIPQTHPNGLLGRIGQIVLVIAMAEPSIGPEHVPEIINVTAKIAKNGTVILIFAVIIFYQTLSSICVFLLLIFK